MDRPFVLPSGLAVVTTLILLGVQLLGGAVLAIVLIFGGTESDWRVSPTWLLAILMVCALVCALQVALRFGRSSWKNRDLLLPARPVPLAGWLALLPLLAGNAVIVLNLTAWLMACLPASWVSTQGLDMFFDLQRQPWAVSVLVVLVAPIGEEILFRGVILTGLLHKLSAGRAILLSTVLFGAAHANLAQLPVSLVLGLTLGWVFVRTRSIGLCITLHLLHNATFAYGWSWPTFWPGLQFPLLTSALNPAPAGLFCFALVLSAAGLTAFHLATRTDRPRWHPVLPAPPPLLPEPPLLSRE